MAVEEGVWWVVEMQFPILLRKPFVVLNNCNAAAAAGASSPPTIPEVVVVCAQEIEGIPCTSINPLGPKKRIENKFKISIVSSASFSFVFI